MSEPQAFTDAIQKELKAIATRNEQIDTLFQLNKIAYTSISDLVSRHPALAAAKEEPAVIPISEHALLKSHDLYVKGHVCDKENHIWSQVEDRSAGQMLVHAFENLFEKYMSPTIAAKIHFSFLCRGFIRPIEPDQVKNQNQVDFVPMMTDLMEAFPFYEGSVFNLSSNNLMAFLGKNRPSGFYRFSYNDAPMVPMWFVLNLSDTYVVYKLHAKEKEDFVDIYIDQAVDGISTKYVNTLFDSASAILNDLTSKLMK